MSKSIVLERAFNLNAELLSFSISESYFAEEIAIDTAKIVIDENTLNSHAGTKKSVNRIKFIVFIPKIFRSTISILELKKSN